MSTLRSDLSTRLPAFALPTLIGKYKSCGLVGDSFSKRQWLTGLTWLECTLVAWHDGGGKCLKIYSPQYTFTTLYTFCVEMKSCFWLCTYFLLYNVQPSEILLGQPVLHYQLPSFSHFLYNFCFVPSLLLWQCYSIYPSLNFSYLTFSLRGTLCFCTQKPFDTLIIPFYFAPVHFHG